MNKTARAQTSPSPTLPNELSSFPEATLVTTRGFLTQRVMDLTGAIIRGEFPRAQEAQVYQHVEFMFAEINAIMATLEELDDRSIDALTLQARRARAIVTGD